MRHILGMAACGLGGGRGREKKGEGGQLCWGRIAQALQGQVTLLAVVQGQGY